jgi:hypothetical protein
MLPRPINPILSCLSSLRLLIFFSLVFISPTYGKILIKTSQNLTPEYSTGGTSVTSFSEQDQRSSPNMDNAFKPACHLATPRQSQMKDATSLSNPPPPRKSFDPNRNIMEAPTKKLGLPSLDCDQSKLFSNIPSCKLRPRRSKPNLDELFLRWSSPIFLCILLVEMYTCYTAINCDHKNWSKCYRTTCYSALKDALLYFCMIRRTFLNSFWFNVT